MLPRCPSNIAIAAFLSLLLISCPTDIDSFQLSRIPSVIRPMAVAASASCRKYPHRASNSSSSSPSRRYQTVDMPRRPMEEEREKNSNRPNNDDANDSSDTKEWKQVVGGFVPRFLKRGGGGGGDSTETATKEENPYTAVQLVDTLEDYKRVVVDERDHIVVVRFFAPWCKSCKAAMPFFKKMAWDHTPNVKFVEVPLTKETAYIHEGLGVPSVPFGHIYHPEVGLVEERKINKKLFREFREALEDYVRGSCDLPDDVVKDEEDNDAQIEDYILIDDDGFQ